MSIICRLCGNEKNNNLYAAREMMFGFRDKFIYVECANCGCLQIKDYPDDLVKYYPSNYFSYKKLLIPSDNFITIYFLHKWVEFSLTGKSFIGNIISKIKPIPTFYHLLRKYNIRRDSKVLDVGCGSGKFLSLLHRGGFYDLVGIDPYLPNDLHYCNGFNLFKKDLKDLDQKFDLITLNNSFEHMPKPLDVLKKINNLLNQEGLLIIGIPVIGYAWRYYGINWVQLDAPRHLYLHTTKSMEILSKKSGFIIDDVSYNSDEFQFWGSEQYIKNIPLIDDRSYWMNPANSIFSKNIETFKHRALELNQKRDGDQASFILKKC
jgi:SAM-dependent methyltransferase